MNRDTSEQQQDRTEPQWDAQPGLLGDLALQDLTEIGEVRPTLVAFTGDDALFLATLRPFAKGAYHEPMIELGALAMAAGANRLACSFGGRAWSLQDPIPPVVRDLGDAGDLRQRVVLVHVVDASRSRLRSVHHVRPVRGPDTALRLDEPQVHGEGTGWLADALAIFAANGRARPDETLIEQVIRCERLGHSLAWGDVGLARLAESGRVAERMVRGSL